jgi:hypothetical protein
MSLVISLPANLRLTIKQVGSVNLFTIRHDPGRVVHSLSGHLGPVSALAMLPGEKGFISAGWDGEALVRGYLRTACLHAANFTPRMYVPSNGI